MIVGFQRLCCHAVHSGGGDGGTDVERRERLHERLHCRELGPPNGTFLYSSFKFFHAPARCGISG